jgi:hypothetical protein
MSQVTSPWRLLCSGCRDALNPTRPAFFRDDECRIRTDHAPANLATIRRMPYNLIRTAPGKASWRLKRKAAGWDDNLLAEIIAR